MITGYRDCTKFEEHKWEDVKEIHTLDLLMLPTNHKIFQKCECGVRRAK